MNAFDFQAPESLAEAVALLVANGDRARPLAGGTDLIPQLRAGLFKLDLVIDVKRIPELNRLTFDHADGLTIGAAVPCCLIYEQQRIANAYPCLIDAISRIGGTAVQGRASVGGNLCNSAPSGDSIPAMIVLGATCLIVGPQGHRTVPVEQFCTGPGKNALGRGELLVSLHIPAPRAHSGARYLRFIPRNEMDLAVVGAGASVVLNDDRSTITAARIALGVVAPTPLLMESVAGQMIGRPATDETIAEAAAMVQETVRPRDTMRGTAAQRRHLAGVLTGRTLRGAITRARGNTIDDE